MDQNKIRISNEKIVLKATQSVWAVNKYFVLASSQKDYLNIRELLRIDKRDLNAAYFVLKRTEDTYCNVSSEALPQISNALYHMAGYFKKLLSS